MLPHPLTNFEIQKYYQNEPRSNGVFSRDNLPKKIKVGAYIINLGEYVDVGTHWIALFYRKSEIVYFGSLVLNMFLKKIGTKNIKAITFRVQSNSSVMCEYICIRFLDFILAGKTSWFYKFFFSL